MELDDSKVWLRLPSSGTSVLSGCPIGVSLSPYISSSSPQSWVRKFLQKPFISGEPRLSNSVILGSDTSCQVRRSLIRLSSCWIGDEVSLCLGGMSLLYLFPWPCPSLSSSLPSFADSL